MKASYLWLRELVPRLDASPLELAARLTGAGLEVEGVTEFGEATDSCVVARVEALRPHPTKTGLRLVTVDRGGAAQDVVCGAPNVPDPGGLVVLAPLGARLPAKELVIARRAIAGIESEGMLCSEDELGLGDAHDGILVLPPGTAEPGATLAKAVPSARDTVLELGLTPNRPDGLGHVGLAREICALYGLPFEMPATGSVPKVADVETAKLVAIVVEDAERCPHYGAAAVVDVAIRPSPLAVKYRLLALGVRSISTVVDVTNLVMLEYGHPMHAFDLDRVRGAKIVVRRAKEAEKMTTLDGLERALSDDDLLVCDGEGPVALAGVMGGASSEICADTRRVLFECAWFDPRGVRRSARRHGMHTESSHRFERGVDPGDVARALDRAVSLTLGLGAGAAARGRVHVQGARVAPEPAPPERRAVRLRARRVRELLGIELPFGESVALLERLGCSVSKREADACEVLAPTHRPDISREVDLVEELVRVHGIDRVPAELPAIRASRDVGGREDLARRARDVAAALGLSEAITYGFTSARVLELLRAPRPAVLLSNPLGEHHAVMRTTLIPGLLDAVQNARRRGVRDVREFTVGPAFLPSKGGGDGLPYEELRLAVVLAGDRPGWLERPKALDAWDAKGYATELVRRLDGASPAVVPAHGREAPAHLHPRGACFVEVAGVRVGSFGPLHPDVEDALELGGEVFVIELSLEPFLSGQRPPRFAALPRFPAATRDVALVVEDGIPAGEVERAVLSAAGPLAAGVHLFDRFAGGQLPAGHSSLAFHVVYRAHDRTLTDAEVDLAHANVVKDVGARFGATLRQ